MLKVSKRPVSLDGGKVVKAMRMKTHIEVKAAHQRAAWSFEVGAWSELLECER